MTNPVEKTAITDAATQDGDVGNVRLEWSQPTLLRGGIERVTRSGAYTTNSEGTVGSIFYAPS